jgi:hypothetical protein
MSAIALHLSGDEPLLATFALALDVEQLDSMDGAEHMTASELAVDASGLLLTLPVVGGRLRYLPETWRGWWPTSGFTDCDGIRALAVLRAFALWESSRPRHRGEHGPPAAGDDLRRLLLSAALAAVANGLSYRAAVNHALDEHDLCGSHEALLRRLKRHMAKGR